MDQATLNMIGSIMQMQKQGSLAAFRHLNTYAHKGETVFVGSSIMEQFPVNELLMNDGLPYVIYNRGIGATVSAELLENIEVQILDLEPKKLFINIGTNDLSLPGDYLPDLISNYRAILEAVKQRLPLCKIHMLAYFPVADASLMDAASQGPGRTQKSIDQANEQIEKLAAEMGCEFIDVNDLLVGENGYLKQEFAADQVHILPNAYQAILQRLIPYLG